MGTPHRHNQIPALLAHWAQDARHVTARALADAEARLVKNAQSLGQAVTTRRQDTAVLSYQTLLGKGAERGRLAVGLCPQEGSVIALAQLRVLDTNELKMAGHLSETVRSLPRYTYAPSRREIQKALMRKGRLSIDDNHPVLTLVEQGICAPAQTADLRHTALIENFLFQPSDQYPQTKAADAMLGFILGELFELNFTMVLAVSEHCRNALPESALKWSGAEQKISTNAQGKPVHFVQWDLSNQPHRACPAHWAKPVDIKL